MVVKKEKIHFWFVAGSQHLYGSEALQEVSDHAQEIVQHLNILTLAGMLLFRGLTLVVLGGRTIAPFPTEFRTISSAFLPDIFAGGELKLLTILIGIVASVIYIMYELRQRKISKFYQFQTSSYGLFLTKLAILVLIINSFTYVLALYQGLPIVLLKT